MSSVNEPVSSVAIFLGACLQTRENAPKALWSAATGRRFVRLADLSAEQRRVERREKPPEPTVRSGIVRLTTFDGDKSPAESGDESPHSKGFALCTPRLIFYLITGLLAMPAAAGEDAAQNETLAQESVAAYKASPFSEFSRDYFARFSRDPDVKAAKHEVAVDSTWQVSDPPSPSVCAATMRGYFQDFLQRRMQVTLGDGPKAGQRSRAKKQIILREAGGGVPGIPESYTLEITKDRVLVQGRDAPGLRDGIVRLVDLMGFRQGPVLPLGISVVKPRLPVRLGAVPYLGSFREAVFLGYNAVFVPAGSLFELSTSDALPELQSRRNPQLRTNFVAAVNEAAQLGLKTYCWLETRQGTRPPNHLSALKGRHPPCPNPYPKFWFTSSSARSTVNR